MSCSFCRLALPECPWLGWQVAQGWAEQQAEVYQLVLPWPRLLLDLLDQ